MIGKPLAVAGCIAVILAENVLLDLDHPLLVQSGSMGTGRTLAIVVMVMAMVMGVVVRMIMPVGVLFVIMALDPGFTFAATTYSTHLSSPRVL